MTVRRSALWLAALVALMLGVAGPAAATEPVETCLAETFPTNQLRCLIQAATAAADAKLCLGAENPGVRWMCVANTAEATGDAAHCLVLPEAEAIGPQGLSRELCRVHLAIAWKQPEFCADLATPNLGDACYLQMVGLGADAALCARIENELLKSACGGQ
jgi:hypothetical protein